MSRDDGGVTSWLSCDEADADPVRFWAGFIQAPRAVAPGFGADAAELLAMDGVMSADVTASIANDAARLPAGSVIVVDDFHAAAAAARTMTDLVERWPASTAQLVLAGRVDPPVRLHRLRLSGDSTDAMPDPFLKRIIGAALEVRATQPERSARILTAPLTDAELRVLKLLPTAGYVQIAATLYISRNTVKSHLRSIYQKLGGASRSEAIERAVELRLL